MKRFAEYFVSACIALCTLMLIGTEARAAEEAVAPPKGSALILALAADGVQIYACEAKDGGYAWIFKAPEATLFDSQGLQLGTHFAGPTWKHVDGSALTGELVTRADAPEAGAIPWLLLRAKTHAGSGVFSAAEYIRRADTKGGAAPKSPCNASHAGEQARMRYSATYQYFSASK